MQYGILEPLAPKCEDLLEKLNTISLEVSLRVFEIYLLGTVFTFLIIHHARKKSTALESGRQNPVVSVPQCDLQEPLH